MAVSVSQSLNNLRLDLLRQHSIVVNKIREKNDCRAELIRKIEYVTLKIIKALAKNQVPQFESINFSQPENCFFNERLRLKGKNDLKKKKISFGMQKNRHRFAVIVFLLSKIHKLLSTCEVNTRREIYYGNINLFQSQDEVDEAMTDVCYILASPPWELGVISTVKGIVSGPLLFKIDHDIIINCEKPGGVLIPPNILEVELISKGIQWALIIENDATFQSIMYAAGLSKLKECLFITVVFIQLIFIYLQRRKGVEIFYTVIIKGKGFPDIHTRLLVCRLWECFKIPILALVDADPYGLEIMCVYRFGSVKSCIFSDRLACPSVRWLGIHPSDIKLLDMDFTTLSEREARKMYLISERPYIKENEKLRNEVRIMMEKNMKAKIEGMSNISTNYITNVYIPSKIICKGYF